MRGQKTCDFETTKTPMWSLRKITELTAGAGEILLARWLFLAVFDSTAITYFSRLSAIIGETYQGKRSRNERGPRMYPPEVIRALKDALKSIYWYKDDLRLFLSAVELPAGLVARQGWHDPQEYKVRIVGKVLDELVASGEEGLGPMRRLIQAVLEMPNFDHLRDLDNGAAKVQGARRSGEVLRELVSRHDESFSKRETERGTVGNKIMEAVKRRNDELERLARRFTELVGTTDPQARGFLFESFLHDMFAAYDLNPRGSFKITGEQIDGAFEFEGTQFLVEARWEKKRQSAHPLIPFLRRSNESLRIRSDYSLRLRATPKRAWLHSAAVDPQ